MRRKKILLVFGTRPEAIKMAPLYLKLREHSSSFETRVCVTAQHREMLDQVLAFFEIAPDYDLNLMVRNQSLYDLTGRILSTAHGVLDDFKPDLVLVHGDTTTSMASALAAFYHGCKIGHVEAGLRTFNKLAPFPEEANRSITARIADLHFAPTEFARSNLMKENIAPENIFVTGNTVIDALLLGKAKIGADPSRYPRIEALAKVLNRDRKLVLVTGHRRENFGDGFDRICNAIQEIAKTLPVHIVYPVHSNPNVLSVVTRNLGSCPNVTLIDPQPYESFLWLMDRAHLILTDSGGVQEEAPALGKPVLVMRETTERPEAVAAGTVILVGTDADAIVRETGNLVFNDQHYAEMSRRHNPYGDGRACERIIDVIAKRLIAE